jgi:hypothetical protein
MKNLKGKPLWLPGSGPGLTIALSLGWKDLSQNNNMSL